MGPFGLGATDDRGHRLSVDLWELGLVSAAGYFYRALADRWTHEHKGPRVVVRNCIDYVFVPATWWGVVCGSRNGGRHRPPV